MAKGKGSAGDAGVQHYPAGSIIFSKGDRAELMYVVQEGTVECLDGDRLINTIPPGGFLGELGLINHQPRSLTARARFDCELKVLDEPAFMERVKQNPYFALEIMRTLADRVRQNTSA